MNLNKNSFHQKTIQSGIPCRKDSFKSWDGTSIHYEVRGEGPSVILIYGIGCVTNHWHFQYEHFAKTHQMIVFDLRGHHQSSLPQDKSNLCLESIAKDVHALKEHLKIKKPVGVWTHSFGGVIGIKAYELFPGDFQHFIMVSGFAKNPFPSPFGFPLVSYVIQFCQGQYKKKPYLWQKLWEKVASSPLCIPISGLLGGFNLQLTPTKDMEIYFQGLSELHQEVFLNLFQELLTYDGTSSLKKITIPTLIFNGKRDLLTPLSCQQYLHRHIPQSQLVSLPYASHCPQLDFPELTNLKIEKFLQPL